MTILQDLKGFRTLIVAALGLSPVLIDALTNVDFDNGTLVFISSLALAGTAILRAFTNTTIFKRS